MQNELAILEFIHCLVETLDRCANVFGARCKYPLHMMTIDRTVKSSPRTC